MEECLKTNKVCSNCNKKCKECKLDNCKETIKMEDRLEKLEYNDKLNAIKAQLPKMCKECSMIQIINLDKQIVYCSYMLKRCCLK